MTAKVTNVLIVLLLAVSLIPVTYLSTLGYAGDSVLSPIPLLALYPAFLGSIWFVYIVPPLVFLLWNIYLFKRRETVPKRTSAVFLLLVVLNVLYFVSAWSVGVEYQGVSFTKAIFLFNVLAMGVLGLLWFMALKTKHYAANLLFSWMLFVWLTWLAFPYLGES